MRMLQLYLCLAAVFDITFSFAINRQSLHLRTKRDAAKQVDCQSMKYTAWSSWGPCFADNDSFRQVKWRMREGFSSLSNVCPKLWKERACEAIDISASDSARCDLTEWTDWSDCFYTVGGFAKERHRIHYSSPKGSFKCSEIQSNDLVEYQKCKDDCAWAEWSACLKDRSQERPRWEKYRVKSSQLHNPLDCPGQWIQYQDCDFCEWAPWANWSPCDGDTKNHTKRRERTRKHSNPLDGKICSLLLDVDAVENDQCSSKDYSLSPSSNPETTLSLKKQDNMEDTTPTVTHAVLGENSG